MKKWLQDNRDFIVIMLITFLVGLAVDLIMDLITEKKWWAL